MLRNSLLNFERISSTVRSMKSHRFAILILCTLFAFMTGSAIADTTLGTPIGKLPYTIKKAGKYRLIKNLTIAENPALFGAIFVTVPGVVIDLNGYTITGPSDSTTNMYGVFSNVERLTIRNGTIAGFARGVATGRNSIVEDLSIVEPTQTGFSAGDHSIVRRCDVTIGFSGSGTSFFTNGGYVGEFSEINECIVRIQGAPGRTMLGLGVGPRSVARNCTAIGIAPDPMGMATAIGFYRNVGVEPSRIEACTAFGFNYGFSGPALNYDRCHASDFAIAAKDNGVSVTGNSF
ncbi:MAG: hypothetical protein RL088_2192 [Verrucomicrobiota bacterium]|jgi:hypothetical protein